MLELAILRNRLILGSFDEKEKELVDAVRDKIVECESTPFARIALSALENCERDVKKGDFKSAANEIQLIHNFPLGEEDVRSWNENHFYRIELLDYMEKTDNVDRIKALIKELARI